MNINSKQLIQELLTIELRSLSDSASSLTRGRTGTHPEFWDRVDGMWDN